MQKGNSMTGAIVALVLGLAVGGGVGYAVAEGYNSGNDNHDSSASVKEETPNSATKAADLRKNLNLTMGQHVELATIALKDTASNNDGAEAAVAALDDNSVELADAIGNVYGDEARNDFLKLWRAHISFFVDYTNGAVAGDETAMKKAKADINGYTEDASTFFANANPNINKSEMKQGLQKHGEQVFAIVDAYAAGDYEKTYQLEDEAYEHIGGAADNLSAAIVKQFPEKF